MGQLKELTTVEEWEQFLVGSNKTVSLLFKHSTQCPISAEAYEEFQSFVKENEQFQFGVVKVIESRPISNQIAEKLEVVHKSPQLFVLEDQKVKWTESHWNIKKQSIQDHV